MRDKTEKGNITKSTSFRVGIAVLAVLVVAVSGYLIYHFKTAGKAPDAPPTSTTAPSQDALPVNAETPQSDSEPTTAQAEKPKPASTKKPAPSKKPSAGSTEKPAAKPQTQPQKEVKANPFIVPKGKTMVCAHRSGGGIAPENTMMAFQNCIENKDFSIDIFEFDLHLTKDGELVLLHDDTLDRTSDAVEVFGHEKVYPHNYTYDELLQLNMGYGFVTDSGETPYKDLQGEAVPENLRITRVQEVLNYLRHAGDFNYVIEIKDAGSIGIQATDKLYDILKSYNLLSKVIVGTFHGEISSYIDNAHPDMLRSASIAEVVDFYFSSLLGVEHEAGYYKFCALQIPDNIYVGKLGTPELVAYAHKHNLAVQYWTINNAQDVRRLADCGADAIMSDIPDMVYQTLYGNP